MSFMVIDTRKHETGIYNRQSAIDKRTLIFVFLFSIAPSAYCLLPDQ
jgi:hypothetical protein